MKYTYTETQINPIWDSLVIFGTDAKMIENGDFDTLRMYNIRKGDTCNFRQVEIINVIEKVRVSVFAAS